MRDGFVKVAAGTPKIRVADCAYNAGQVIALMEQAAEQGVKVLALPELCLTGYTCGDLFAGYPSPGGGGGPGDRAGGTKELDVLAAVGLPVRNKWTGKLYNCAAVMSGGDLGPGPKPSAQLRGILRAALVCLRRGR